MFEVYGELVKCEIDWDSFGRSEVFKLFLLINIQKKKGTAVV